MYPQQTSKTLELLYRFEMQLGFSLSVFISLCHNVLAAKFASICSFL
jgi:hypothetical protein